MTNFGLMFVFLSVARCWWCFCIFVPPKGSSGRVVIFGDCAWLRLAVVSLLCRMKQMRIVCRQLLSTCSGTLWQPPCHHFTGSSGRVGGGGSHGNNAPRWPERVFFWLWLLRAGLINTTTTLQRATKGIPIAQAQARFQEVPGKKDLAPWTVTPPSPIARPQVFLGPNYFHSFSLKAGKCRCPSGAGKELKIFTVFPRQQQQILENV